MTPPAVVQAEGLGKRYRLGAGAGKSLREALVQRVRTVRRPRPEVWALRNVDLEVGLGEAVGVLGRNGAGKSTLLKLLSRITEPTEGVARTRGRVAAMLEVGTGFHSELTGRENVYLNAAILGMGRRDVQRRFDDIVAFAGFERFVDTPVKRYSSGMQLRLAFSVAAHLEPDILVVDEVLAVGDAEFQRRCLGRMAEAEREGRTIVFVSHDLEAMARLCPRAVWLDAGRVRDQGPTGAVVDAYLQDGLADAAPSLRPVDPERPVTLRSVLTCARDGRAAPVLRRDEPFAVELRLAVPRPVPGLDVAVFVETVRGTRVFDEALSDGHGTGSFAGAGEYRVRLDVPPVLNAGDYVVGVWAGTAYDDLLHEPAAARLRLEGGVGARPTRAVVLDLPFTVEPLPVDGG